MIKKSSISRRDFVRFLAIGGVSLAALRTIDLENLVSSSKIKETRYIMGTVVNFTAVSSDEKQARAALSASLDRMIELENIFSRFNTGSQLSLLNRDGKLRGANLALVDLIKLSTLLSKSSNGAFDISIKPLLDLYTQASTKKSNLPGMKDIEEKLRLVDYSKVIIDGKDIFFSRPKMEITLDGIAKGYIIDQAAAVLKENGFPNILVEAGGDLYCSGWKDGNHPWNISILPPRSIQADGAKIAFQLHNQAAATSGDYMQTFTADYKQHHILDPRRGYSPADLASVTVVAPSTVLADGMATTLMVMGYQNGLKWLNDNPDIQAYFVTKDLQTFHTKDFPLIQLT